MKYKKHRGIVLGVVNFGHGFPDRYRVRHGREVAYCTIAALNREWLEAYVELLRGAGRPERAMQLQSEWLAEQRRCA